MIKSVLLNCSKLLIAFALGLIVCGNGRAETRSVSSKNKACFGDTTDVLLVGDSIRNELKLKVPTKYFGDLPIYRGAEQMYHTSRLPDPWPNCANEPIRLPDLQLSLIEGLQQKFNPEHVADRTGSALAEFPKASFDFIGIKIGEWKFRDMSEIDKVELRRRFDRQYALRNTKTTNDSLEYLNLEKVSADPSVYKIYFGIGQLVEPLDGQSIVFNCKEHVWGDLGPGGSPQCVVAYALDDETGISVYYKFYEDLMPKQTWVSLDQKMRRFFVDMISDPKIKSRLEKAAISP